MSQTQQTAWIRVAAGSGKERTIIAKATGFIARLVKETIAFGLQNS
jgi:hypothetical protein